MTTPTPPVTSAPPQTDDPRVVGLTTPHVRVTAEQYVVRSKRCCACNRALAPDDAPDLFCHGCGEFFCGNLACPAAGQELDVPSGHHLPDDHLSEDDDQ